jgi:hypothetical protein
MIPRRSASRGAEMQAVPEDRVTETDSLSSFGTLAGAVANAAEIADAVRAPAR